MKQFFLDVIRISGKVTFGMVLFVSISFISCFCYTAMMKNSLSFPFNWFAFSYQTTTSGEYGVQMEFSNGGLSVLLIAIICMSLFILGIQKMTAIKKFFK